MDNNEINRSIINYLRSFNPERIGIFGSFARREQTPTSDKDLKKERTAEIDKEIKKLQSELLV